MLAGLLLALSNTLLYTRKCVPVSIRRYYYIVLYCTIYKVALTELYVALWERCSALCLFDLILYVPSTILH